MNWTEVIKKFPEANFLQSPNYARMNELIGAKTITEDFGGDGYALMIVRDAKRGRYLEIPCGPLIDWGQQEASKTNFGKDSRYSTKRKVRIRKNAAADLCNC